MEAWAFRAREKSDPPRSVGRPGAVPLTRVERWDKTLDLGADS